MTHDELAEQLQQFDADPRQAMNSQPPKSENRAKDRQEAQPPFTVQESRAGNEFVEQRDSYRKRLKMEDDGQIIRLEQVLPGRAPIANNDRPERLVDQGGTGLLRTLEAMEQQGLLRARLRDSPWSDWYWPIYQGILGCRYNDPSFPLNSEDWKQKRDYIAANPAARIIASGDPAAIARLSPSEKYDLLIGDDQGTLTRQMWSEGEAYHRQSGKVERWMGICHGWAPAAYMLARPAKAIQVLAADGRTKIRFLPSDIKALGSLLWAKAAPSVRFIGGRCNDKNPATDENGRVRSQACFDTNPGTFHIAIVNQIGLRKRSFIIDATFDYEVWNQPVYDYEYTYFNPQTRRPARSLEGARVLRSAFPNDRFAAYRSANATSLVGIGLKLSYGAETMPSSSEQDSAENDYRKTVSYVYDLELDSQGNILGGEWYNNAHPDFLWTPPPGAVAESTADHAASGTWNDDTLPESWRRAAIAAARNGQPLARLVHALINWSKV